MHAQLYLYITFSHQGIQAALHICNIRPLKVNVLHEVVLKIDCQEQYIELLCQSIAQLLPLLWPLIHIPFLALENSFPFRKCIILEDEHCPEISNYVPQMPGKAG